MGGEQDSPLRNQLGHGGLYAGANWDTRGSEAGGNRDVCFVV